MAIWLLLLGYTCVAIAFFHLSGFRMTGQGGSAYYGILAGSGSVIGLLFLQRPTRPLVFLNRLFQYGLFGMATVLLSYACATTGRPLADAAMYRFDQAIGYRWDEWFWYLGSRPRIGYVLHLAYCSFFAQPTIAFAMLSLRRDENRANEFILCSMIAMAFTLLIFSLFPVTTAWTHLRVPVADLQRMMMPMADHEWVPLLQDIRAGIRTSPQLGKNLGLIGLPSYHLIAALLFLRVFWSMPRLRIPMTALNIVMIAATPIVGGHYIADLVGGAGVALVSMYLGRSARLWGDAHIARIAAGAPALPRGAVLAA